jgi:hypothetical protein
LKEALNIATVTAAMEMNSSAKSAAQNFDKKERRKKCLKTVNLPGECSTMDKQIFK